MNIETKQPSQVEIALEIAIKAHKGQRDLDGNPVIIHPLTVAMKGNNENEIVAGLLHDVVEDTDWTFDDLLNAGISTKVVDALRLLTHDSDIEYLDYVKRIADTTLGKEKARLKRRIRHSSWLRIYAIKLASGVYIITGGAIKLTATMQEREHTQTELSKMEKVRNFLLNEGIINEDGFIEYLNTL